MENKPLSDKQDAFARFYASNGFNGTQAAISAGYAENSAAVESVRLLRIPKIIDRIAELTKGTVARAKKGADDVYELASDAAFFDIGEVLEMDETGVFLKHGMKLSDVDPRLRRLIQAVKSKPTNFGIVNEIIFVDKLKALEMLARFNGMNKDKLEVTTNLTEEERKSRIAELKAKLEADGTNQG